LSLEKKKKFFLTGVDSFEVKTPDKFDVSLSISLSDGCVIEKKLSKEVLLLTVFIAIYFILLECLLLVFIYLFIYLFIYCLFTSFLFNLFTDLFFVCLFVYLLFTHLSFIF
jgi:hypothetical protein